MVGMLKPYADAFTVPPRAPRWLSAIVFEGLAGMILCLVRIELPLWAGRENQVWSIKQLRFETARIFSLPPWALALRV